MKSAMTLAKFSVRKRLLDFMPACLPAWLPAWQALAAYAAYAQRADLLYSVNRVRRLVGCSYVTYTHTHTHRVNKNSQRPCDSWKILENSLNALRMRTRDRKGCSEREWKRVAQVANGLCLWSYVEGAGLGAKSKQPYSLFSSLCLV